METIKEFGRVIAVNENFVTIAVQSNAGDCHGCAMASLCTGGEIEQKQIEIPRRQVNFSVQPGQKVELSFDRVLEYSLLVYLIPISFFLLAILLANFFLKISNELHLFLCSLVGLALGFFLLRIVNNLINRKGLKLQIKLVGED